jgi:hypothetical protein
MLRFLEETFLSLLTRTTVSVVLLCSLLAAAAGPFGTYETAAFLPRLFYWFLVSSVSLVIGQICMKMARKLVPENRPFLRDGVMIAIMVLAFSPVLYLLTHGLLVQGGRDGPTLLKLAYYVAAITAGICAARRILHGYEAIGHFGRSRDPARQEPRLMRRLSPCFKGPILRLTVRDHCVDVVSRSAVETIRFRFADAIDEMEPVRGHCTHRSHWVAQDAIESVDRTDGKIHLKLINGDLVPVSRKYRPGLEDAGLI